MRKSLFAIAALFILTHLSGCKEDKLEPVENDGVPPGSISAVEVKALPGAARINYEVPADEDLLYIMAQYTNLQNKVMTVKSSLYNTSLLVNGFGDTSSYEVKLYAVDRSENKSVPYVVHIKPLEPPVYSVFKGIKAVPDFGGINITTLNPIKADLAIILLRKDSLGDYVIDDTKYTDNDTINYSVRGYDTTRTSFAIYVRDRWLNISDTLFTNISPIYEKELDKALFKQVILPTDVPYNWGCPIPGLWDKKIPIEGTTMWHSADVTSYPMNITFDLGKEYKLSRYILWQRPGKYLYGHGNPLDYEIYGATNPPADGSWDGWTLLNHCISVRPSGLPLGAALTNEDVAKGDAGEEWNVPFTAPKVRYIRIRINETWSGGNAAHIAEMSFWGNDL